MGHDDILHHDEVMRLLAKAQACFQRALLGQILHNQTSCGWSRQSERQFSGAPPLTARCDAPMEARRQDQVTPATLRGNFQGISTTRGVEADYGSTEMREIDRSPSPGQLQPESGLGGGLGSSTVRKYGKYASTEYCYY